MFRFIKRLLCCILILLLCITGLLCYMGYREYRASLDEKSLEAAVAEIRDKASFTHLSVLPKTYTDAIVAAEDHRFRLHFGIDPLGIGRALMVDFRDKELKEGGSTITQQLAKNLYYPTNRNLISKIAEAFMAVRLERDYSKDDILELYVNCIYFGDGYYCVRDASLGYFNKEPEQMNDYECTLLAGVPNAPSVYAPTKNPDLAEQRRRVIVRRMLSQGYINDDEADSLIGEE